MSGMDRLTDADVEWHAAHGAPLSAAMARELLAHRRASQVAPAHEDDLAVDRFAAVMKAKLAKKRNDGRGGWSGPECSEETLSRMLRDHIAKGDPVDVANFAMMLHQRGERIAQAAPAPSDGLWEAAIAEALNCLDGEPEYHESGMGCGLEDRNITDRYEAMAYGWNQAMERIFSEHINPAIEALTPAPAQEGGE